MGGEPWLRTQLHMEVLVATTPRFSHVSGSSLCISLPLGPKAVSPTLTLSSKKCGTGERQRLSLERLGEPPRSSCMPADGTDRTAGPMAGGLSSPGRCLVLFCWVCTITSSQSPTFHFNLSGLLPYNKLPSRGIKWSTRQEPFITMQPDGALGSWSSHPAPLASCTSAQERREFLCYLFALKLGFLTLGIPEEARRDPRVSSSRRFSFKQWQKKKGVG